MHVYILYIDRIYYLVYMRFFHSADMGLTNVVAMVPFCRTVPEGRRVVDLLAKFGLDRSKDPSFQVPVKKNGIRLDCYNGRMRMSQERE